MTSSANTHILDWERWPHQIFVPIAEGRMRAAGYVQCVCHVPQHAQNVHNWTDGVGYDWQQDQPSSVSLCGCMSWDVLQMGYRCTEYASQANPSR